MTFAESLRETRDALNLTQEQTAACIPELSRRTLEAWEVGRQTPPLWCQLLVLAAIERVARRVKTRGKRMESYRLGDVLNAVKVATKRPKPKT